MRKSPAGRLLLSALLHFACYAGAYALVSMLLNRPAFPGLPSLIAAIDSRFLPDFTYHMIATMSRWGIVFAVGAITAIPVGILIGFFRPIDRAIAADVDFWRSLPATTLIVFVMAAFGDNLVARTFPALYITFFTIVFYVSRHARDLDRIRINHLRELGASRSFILRHCVIYELLPPILIAARQAVSLSFLVLVSVELIVGPAGDRGIGRILYDWQLFARYSEIIASLFFLGLIGYILNIATAYFQRSLVPWRSFD